MFDPSDIEDLSDAERELLIHTLQTIRRSRHQGLHFFANFLGLEWDLLDNGRARVRLPLGLQVRNTRGVAQGGAVATLADLAMGSAVRSALPPDKRVVTAEMKVNYLRPGDGNELVADARCIHTGRRFGVSEVKIHNDAGKLVALGTGTFAIVKPLGGEPDPGDPRILGAGQTG